MISFAKIKKWSVPPKVRLSIPSTYATPCKLLASNLSFFYTFRQIYSRSSHNSELSSLLSRLKKQKKNKIFLTPLSIQFTKNHKKQLLFLSSVLSFLSPSFGERAHKNSSNKFSKIKTLKTIFDRLSKL